MKNHLKSSTENCVWGYFDAKEKTRYCISSGEEITIETVSGGPNVIPSQEFYTPPELLEIHKLGVPQVPGHILTGPVSVEGAMPGDTLQVDILDISLRQDWGYNFIRPLSGALPYDFDEEIHMNIPLDRDKMIATLPWGLELPLSPFFGVMGVAPPSGWGRISSIMPRAHGGNIDNKELLVNSTLYLPIFNKGAQFSVGDGHALQGDGEVCVTAIETALKGKFRLTVRKDLRLNYPQAETSTHYITMGMDPDLDLCAEMALRNMINLIVNSANISKSDAYTLCSLVGDLRITQVVNGCKGVHMLLNKKYV